MGTLLFVKCFIMGVQPHGYGNGNAVTFIKVINTITSNIKNNTHIIIKYVVKFKFLHSKSKYAFAGFLCNFIDIMLMVD